MSRSTSANFRKAVFDETSEEVTACLLSISHPDLPGGVIRFSSDATQRLTTEPLLTYGTVSRGDQYTFCPFEVKLPSEDDEETPTMTIALDNLGQDLIDLLRSTSEPASVTVEIVLGSTPDVVEASFPNFDLVAADYDVGQVILSLALDGMSSEPFPSGTFNPAHFGGLF